MQFIGFTYNICSKNYCSFAKFKFMFCGSLIVSFLPICDRKLKDCYTQLSSSAWAGQRGRQEDKLVINW